MSQAEVITLILSQVGQMLVFLLPVIAICAVLKIIFDILYDFLFGVTGSRRR